MSFDGVIPDGIQPIVAYRAWRVTIGERVRFWPLGSLFGGSYWEGAESRWVSATCERYLAHVGYCGCWRLPARHPDRATCPFHGQRHAAPHERCSCGFYALKDLGAVWVMAGPLASMRALE